MGIQLKAAENKDQKDFIPCFDRKHRNWNGILFDSAREVFTAIGSPPMMSIMKMS